MHLWVSEIVGPIRLVFSHGIRELIGRGEQLLGAIGGRRLGGGCVHLPVQQGGNPWGSPWRGRAGAQIGLCREGVAAEMGGANDRE